MIYFITGHPGAGKSLLAVSLAFQYIERGCRVASNMTLKLDGQRNLMSRMSAVKLPYILEAQHLLQLGFGDVPHDWNPTGLALPLRNDEGYDESKHGLLLLDECGSWLNSRDWKDKGRRELFHWLTHSRKFGWDVAIIVHDEDALDKQIKDALSDVYVICQDLSKIKIPYLPIHLPKIHRARGFYRSKTGALHKKWSASGKTIWPLYNTRESIRPEGFWNEDGFVDMRGSYSHLSAYTLKGRYLPKPPTLEERFYIFIARTLQIFIGSLIKLLVPRSGPGSLTSSRSFQPSTSPIQSLSRQRFTQPVGYDRYTANLARSMIALRRSVNTVQ